MEEMIYIVSNSIYIDIDYYYKYYETETDLYLDYIKFNYTLEYFFKVPKKYISWSSLTIIGKNYANYAYLSKDVLNSKEVEKNEIDKDKISMMSMLK